MACLMDQAIDACLDVRVTGRKRCFPSDDQIIFSSSA